MVRKGLPGQMMVELRLNELKKKNKKTPPFADLGDELLIGSCDKNMCEYVPLLYFT